MPQTSPHAAILTELEPVVAQNLDRHDRLAKEWHPHDYVPWDEGRNFAFLGGEDWSPEQSRLDDTAKAAMFVNLLTEDNLPSYHREIATRWPRRRLGHLGRPLDGGGEPARRAARLPRGHPRRRPGRAGAGPDGLHDPRLRLGRQDAAGGGRLRLLPGAGDARLAPQHRRACMDPIADQLLGPHLHRREPAHGLLPEPGAGGVRHQPRRDDEGRGQRGHQLRDARANMANFRKNSTIIAKAGIYDLRLHHDEVVSRSCGSGRSSSAPTSAPSASRPARSSPSSWSVSTRRRRSSWRAGAHARPHRRPRPGADRVLTGLWPAVLRTAPRPGAVPPDALSRFVAPARGPSGPPLGATRHTGLMRLATWNVNSIRSRADRVAAFLQRHDVDVLALQETSAGTTSSRR